MNTPLRNFLGDPFALTLGNKIEAPPKKVKEAGPVEIKPGLFQAADGKLSFSPQREVIVRVLNTPADQLKLDNRDFSLLTGRK